MRRAWRARHGSKVVMLLSSTGVQALPAMHRELGANSAVGGKGRPMRRQTASAQQRPMQAAPCSARLSVCLHHRSASAASRQPLRAIRRQVESSRPNGGMARRWRRQRISRRRPYSPSLFALRIALARRHGSKVVMLWPSTGVQALPAMHRELGANSAVGGKGRPMRRQTAPNARSTLQS